MSLKLLFSDANRLLCLLVFFQAGFILILSLILRSRNRTIEKAEAAVLNIKQSIDKHIHANLQVMFSLLSIEENNTDNEELRAALTATELRLYSITAVSSCSKFSHSHISVKLPLLFEKIAMQHKYQFLASARRMSIQVESKIPEIALSQALPLALFFTEILSKTVKFLLSRRKTSVMLSIEIRRQYERADVTISSLFESAHETIDYQDDAGLKDILVRELNGILTFSENTFSNISLSFPLREKENVDIQFEKRIRHFENTIRTAYPPHFHELPTELWFNPRK
jgi:two-component sensor histidine kinase